MKPLPCPPSAVLPSPFGSRGQYCYRLRLQFVMMRFRPSANRPMPSICPSGVMGE